MGKKLNHRNAALIDTIIRENFQKMVGIPIERAVITKKRKKDYFEYVQRMANFLFNHTRMTKEEALKTMMDVEKSNEIEVKG